LLPPAKKIIGAAVSQKPLNLGFWGRRHIGQLRDDHTDIPLEFGGLSPDLCVPGEHGGQQIALVHVAFRQWVDPEDLHRQGQEIGKAHVLPDQ
jgi:hypothetical protein